MKSPVKLALCAALIIIALPALSMGALAKDNDDRGDRDHDRGDRGHVHGVPGPLAGAGLPFIAVGYGVYWLIRRRRRANWS